MVRHAWMFVMLSACGEPILRNAPKPDPGTVAGVAAAAAAAAAATLASPQAAAKKQEEKDQGEPDNRRVKVKETVPADVFDRIDHKAGNASDAGVDATSPEPPAPAP
jgi:hypothetical protein